jgi:hypothetical protein
LISSSDIPLGGPALFVKFFYPGFSDFFIEFYKGFVKAFIKIGLVAGEIFALIAEIHLFFLVAWAHMAVLEKFAVFVAASLAVFRSEKIQHLLEIHIFFKNRIVEQGFKPFGIRFKIPEFFLELQAVSADIPVHVGKTGFTREAAG